MDADFKTPFTWLHCQADYYVALELNYLPRMQNYADNFTQYILMRRVHEVADVVLNKDAVHPDTYNDLFNEYLVWGTCS